jgi:hypothetical protein
MREQKTIIEDNQTISSVFDQTNSVTIDILDRNTITKVMVTYETRSHIVYPLKSIKIASLLNDENLLRQLHLSDISSDDYVLVLEEETNGHILTKDDLQQPIGTHLTTGDQPIHFRISTLIQITKYDDHKQIRIPLSTRDTTIEQLLQSTEESVDTYKYLVLHDTTKIVDDNDKISNLNRTKFILFKENETCLVSIGRSDNRDKENEKYQRYAIFASMADIYKENQLDISHQYLQYANDFVPSTETRLVSFQSELPLEFIVIDDNLPVTVTVKNTETNEIIAFNCSFSMTVKRIYTISCQLFDLNNEFYQLMQDGSTLIDENIALEEIDEIKSEIQFQLTSTASMHCSVIFSEQTITLPCHENTLVSTIVKETLRKLHIPYDNTEQYELIALNDEQTEIHFDTSIDEIRLLFPSITTIPLELRRKKDQK